MRDKERFDQMISMMETTERPVEAIRLLGSFLRERINWEEQKEPGQPVLLEEEVKGEPELEQRWPLFDISEIEAAIKEYVEID